MTLNLTADPDEVKHLLIAARDELKERGWRQGRYGSTDGPKCTLGAVCWAISGNADWIINLGTTQPEVYDVEHALEVAIGTAYIADWNDTSGRSFDEVVAAFDAAIGLVDAEIARRQSVAQVQEIAHLAGIEVAS